MWSLVQDIVYLGGNKCRGPQIAKVRRCEAYTLRESLVARVASAEGRMCRGSHVVVSACGGERIWW
jgi:hypothetical protein